MWDRTRYLEESPAKIKNKWNLTDLKLTREIDLKFSKYWVKVRQNWRGSYIAKIR
jgi:hypothetical protein